MESSWDKAVPTSHLVQDRFCVKSPDKWTSVSLQWPWARRSAELVPSLPANWGEELYLVKGVGRTYGP